jgi:hypothetical protein
LLLSLSVRKQKKNKKKATTSVSVFISAHSSRAVIKWREIEESAKSTHIVLYHAAMCHWLSTKIIYNISEHKQQQQAASHELKILRFPSSVIYIWRRTTWRVTSAARSALN